MVYHTNSFFLGFFSLLNIAMSIPICLILYTYVLKITYFSAIHIMALLIIVGIGADDIFVFHDFWLSTFQIKAIRNEPILRISYTFRQSSKAMMVTSLTSAIAFVACSFTVIMPLKSFGIFAAIIVPTCFVLTITAQPVVYFVYEMYIIPLKIPGIRDSFFRYNRLADVIE